MTQVGRGTPTGDLFRSFWLPFLFSWELEPDGEPERVRLLGEDLIAFRDTDGRVGLLSEPVRTGAPRSSSVATSVRVSPACTTVGNTT